MATATFTVPGNTPAGSYTIHASYSDPFNNSLDEGGRFGSSSGSNTLTAQFNVSPTGRNGPYFPAPGLLGIQPAWAIVKGRG